MLGDHENTEGHGKFERLAALAGLGTLTPIEWSELKVHLQNCEECREVSRQYMILNTHGIPTLAAAYTDREEQRSWEDTDTRTKLFTRVRADQQIALELNHHPSIAVRPNLQHRIVVHRLAHAALAACLVIVVGFGAYRLGARGQGGTTLIPVPAEDRFRWLSAEKKLVEELLAAQAKTLTQLQEASARKEQELAKLQSALHALGDHSNELTAANSRSEGQLQTISQQRDSLNAQLQEAIQGYQNLRAELVNLRGERDKALLRTTSLEAKIEELTALNREEDRKLKGTEQYLASDRDIRELMGARKLYIADVFDVDGSSRTRKPFGRVFYTQGKSLIFYAFDLDRQPGMVNASTFQVWGQRETAQGEQSLPKNLGILYMDNESNRRWVMRFDDPKELAEIDAVFVTVEPRGGSRKPTTKPFLYALLRNEVNHP